jgi:hypothetical protein
VRLTGHAVLLPAYLDPLEFWGYEVSVNRTSGIPVTEPSTAPHLAQAGRRRTGLAIVTYWVEAGVISTAAGAWAATVLSGQLRILLWAGVTTVLAVAAILVADPAIALLARCYQMPLRRRPRA